MVPKPLLKFSIVGVAESVLRLDCLTLHLLPPQLEIGVSKPLHVRKGCVRMTLLNYQNLASMLPFEYAIPFFLCRPSSWVGALRE